MISGQAVPQTSRGRALLALVLGGVLALSGLGSTAEALTITETLNFNDSAAVTDTNITSTGATNNGATFGTQTPSQFNSSTGVLTAVQIVLTSTRTETITGKSQIGTASSSKTLAGTASSTGQIAVPTITNAFSTAITATDTCSADEKVGCTFSKTNAGVTTNATLNVGAANLNTYVGAGTFNATRTAPALSNNMTSNFTGSGTNTSTYTVAWAGSVATTYTYLLHANPSFSNSSGALTLNLNNTSFDGDGIIKQGDGGGSLSVGYTIFNFLNGFLAGDRVGLNLTSITPGGTNSAQATTNLATFTGLAAGLTGNNFTAFLNTTQVGTFTSTFTVHLHDDCVGTHATSTCLADSDLTLNITGTVSEPLPPSVILMAAGTLAMAGTYVVRRRRFGRVAA